MDPIEPIIKHGEIYSERILSEQLVHATDSLIPGPGYSLTLEGMHSSALQQKELEAFFGFQLDTETGAKIILNYDAIQDKLVIAQLVCPIANDEGIANLFRLEGGVYGTSIEINGGSHAALMPTMPQETVEQLMSNFGITEAPIGDLESYQAWRDSLLQQTAGWHLLETQEIPEAITVDSAQFSTLYREEVLNLQKLGVAERRAFTQTIVHYENDTQHKTEHTYELTGEPATSQAVMFISTYSETPESPFVDFGTQKTEPKLTAVPFTADSHKEMTNAFERVTLARQASRRVVNN